MLLLILVDFAFAEIRATFDVARRLMLNGINTLLNYRRLFAELIFQPLPLWAVAKYIGL